MKFTKLILITILAGLFGIAVAAPYQNQQQNRGGQQEQRGQYNGYQPYSAYQDNKPIDIYVQGALGIAGNYQNTNSDYYATQSPNQLGGSAAVQMGLLLNIHNQFVIGPTVGYTNASTSSTTSTFGQLGYSLKFETKVPSTQIGLLAGIKFAYQWMLYMTTGYANNGQEKITVADAASNESQSIKINLNLNQAYMGFGGRYNVTPNMFVGLDYTAYGILSTTNYNLQNYEVDFPGKIITVGDYPINTGVGIFNLTFGMNF